MIAVMRRSHRRELGPAFSHGTWSHAPGGDPTALIIEHSKDGPQRVRCVPDFKTLDAEDYANARLMGAAPDLYRELMRAHRYLRKLGYDMDSINTALNKAREAST